MKKVFLIFSFFIFHFSLSSQVREKQSLNNGWRFVLNDSANIASIQKAKPQLVNLPHTWNALDIIDDTLGYHQGIGWYQKSLFISESLKDKHLELVFEGAGTRATVFINGRAAGTHTGAYTGFAVNLDGLIKFGASNNIVVRVDNSKYLKDTVPPFSGDFSMMGGIYRDVWLEATHSSHFERNHGSVAVYFQTPVVSRLLSVFFVKGRIDAKQTDLLVHYTLKDEQVTVQSGQGNVNEGSGEFSINGRITEPKLWSPDTPKLYTLHVELKNVKGDVLDDQYFNVGFRWFGINDKQEFVLNGKPYKLKGAARHQDYHRLGNALTDAMHVRDVELMKEMGCNFIRISHYPQDPAVYDACDKLGLISWSEIPVVDRVVDNPTFLQNSRMMMQEMIWQHYNHPSVAIWGYHNEVRNLDNVSLTNARELDSIAHTLDPYRLTAIAFEAAVEAPYFKSNPLLKDMLNIADINGYNIYQGWYRGSYKTIGLFLDTIHSFNPQKPIMLSEYGAGSDINIHTYNPTIFDFSEEYKTLFHEAYVKAGMQRPWMVGFSIWNFIDFQKDGREDVSPHVNNKGMVTTDRKPKDVYYYYKSQWSKEPFLYIAGKHWQQRLNVTSNDSIRIPLVVYSNQNQLTLFKNGKPAGTQVSEDGVFNFQVDVRAGNNLFECRTVGGSLTDVLNINYRFIDPTRFSTTFPKHKIHFNTGQSRTNYIDPLSREQWIPDKPYSTGTWGYVGGEVWRNWPGNSAWNNVREGIHKPIANTNDEPLFQTFVQGLQAWKADLPEGKYRLTILLTEPFTDNQRNREERIMDISVNGKIWMQQLNIAKENGIQSAVILDKEVTVKSGEGLIINFTALSGKTILNGVAIEKL